MLKIGKRLICAAVAAAVAVTVAVSASAATLAEVALPYTIGTKISDYLTGNYENNTYSFVLSNKSDINAHLVGTGLTCWADGDNTSNLYYQLLNAGGDIIAPLKFTPVEGKAYSDRLNRNNATKRAEADIRYTNLAAGTYYFRFCSHDDTNGQRFELTTISVQSPFTAGSVAPDVAVGNVAGAISVSWGAVTSAQYAVYYNYQNNVTGAFGNWGIASVNTPAYTIANPVKNATYYITILPYTNAPSRRYGGFSPYVQVRT